MREGKLINNVLIYSTDSFNNFRTEWFGLSDQSIIKFCKRFEVWSYLSFDARGKLWDSIFFFLKLFSTEFGTYKNVYTTNILILDFLTTYRGWRHLKGYPTRGQRTWSNAWSCYNSNTILREIRLSWAKKFYGNVSSSDIKLAFLAEQINLMWMLQWPDAWWYARYRRCSQERRSRQRGLRIDLHLIAFGHVFIPSIKKDLTKKQKALAEKSVLLIGYDVGFTRSVFKELSKFNQNQSTSQRSLIKVIKSKKGKNPKGKNADFKLKKKNHILKKKKKKSVWD